MAEVTKILLLRGVFANLPLLAQGELAFCTDTKKVWIGDGVQNRQVGGDPLPDGDKGDITVTDGGATWSINGRVVGPAELWAVANKRVLGRNTAGTGDVEEVTATQLLDWIDASAAAGSVLGRTATGWAVVPPLRQNAVLTQGFVSGSIFPVFAAVGDIQLRHVEPSGTHGGTITAGSFQVRPLNAYTWDTGSDCVLNSNQFTLQPGWYVVSAAAATVAVGQSKLCIWDVAGAVPQILGLTQIFQNASGQGGTALVSGMLQITVPTTFELRQQVGNTIATWGMGFAVGFGQEVYATVDIKRIR